MFITKVDQAFHVKCFFEEASRGLTAELGVRFALSYPFANYRHRLVKSQAINIRPLFCPKIPECQAHYGASCETTLDSFEIFNLLNFVKKNS